MTGEKQRVSAPASEVIERTGCFAMTGFESSQRLIQVNSIHACLYNKCAIFSR